MHRDFKLTISLLTTGPQFLDERKIDRISSRVPIPWSDPRHLNKDKQNTSDNGLHGDQQTSSVAHWWRSTDLFPTPQYMLIILLYCTCLNAYMLQHRRTFRATPVISPFEYLARDRLHQSVRQASRESVATPMATAYRG